MKNIGQVEIEQGEHFLALDENTNTLYLSNNKSNSILVIDCSSQKTVSRILIEKPRQLVLNSKNNMLYCISGHAGYFSQDTGSKISVIDTTSNQIVGSIGKNEKFGDMKLNQNKNLLYATKPKSKKLWVINPQTNKIINKIKLDGKYKCLAIDEEGNTIYLAGDDVGMSDALSIIAIHGEDNRIEKIAKQSFTAKRTKELHLNPFTKKLFVKTLEPQDHYENSKTRIHVADLESKKFVDSTKHRDAKEGVGFNHFKNRIYFSDVSKGEFSIYNNSLKEIGLFRFTESEGLVDKYFTGHRTPTKIAINSKLNQIYIIDGEKNILHIMQD
jgi:DNA-binding beta-propeller fold protein YncE